MRWKEFLRPNPTKIVLTVFFAFFLGLLLIVLEDLSILPEILISLGVFFLPLGLGVLPFLDEIGAKSIPAGPIKLIILLSVMALHAFFWYIISCLIAWVYNKFKSRGDKK
ncbi:hypothetical protein KKG83_06550 [Candidatus Micrarchaeota archaeon]|nr:hypothetical protein [Candidatus Micrarchaeota archaeon]